MNGVPAWVTVALGIATMVSIIYYAAVLYRARVEQVGAANLKQRRRLGAAIDAWPDDRRDAVVRWHDYPALTRTDIAELLHERRWFAAGQNPRGAGWPLFVTRDRERAESTDPPPDRRALLRDELREATLSGRGVHRLDLAPHQTLGRAAVVREARDAGWQVALRKHSSLSIVDVVRPGLPDVDQFAGANDPGWARTVEVPGSDDEPNYISGLPRAVQRKVNRASAAGLSLLVDGLVLLKVRSDPGAARALLWVGAVLVVVFVILLIHARRAHLARRAGAVGSTVRR